MLFFIKKLKIFGTFKLFSKVVSIIAASWIEKGITQQLNVITPVNKSCITLPVSLYWPVEVDTVEAYNKHTISDSWCY